MSIVLCEDESKIKAYLGVAIRVCSCLRRSDIIRDSAENAEVILRTYNSGQFMSCRQFTMF